VVRPDNSSASRKLTARAEWILRNSVGFAWSANSRIVGDLEAIRMPVHAILSIHGPAGPPIVMKVAALVTPRARDGPRQRRRGWIPASAGMT
jgi:hypothetical protein